MLRLFLEPAFALSPNVIWAPFPHCIHSTALGKCFFASWHGSTPDNSGQQIAIFPNMVEADFNPKVVAEAGKKGVQLTTVNPWNWHHGAFEGIYIDQSTGTMIARGDPRRCSKAEGV